MKRSSFAWLGLVIFGLACSDGQGGPGTGTGGAGGTGGTGPTGSAGAGGTGIGGTVGAAGTGVGGGAGNGGSGGGAGASASGGAGASGSGGAGGSTTAGTGTGGSGGVGGSGASGTGGGAAGTGGVVGTGAGGAAGRGGSGGVSGSGGTGTGGRGGTGGVAGTGGSSGSGGSGGTGGSGGSGGTGGGAGGAGVLRVTSARAFPNVQLWALLVAVDNQDTAIVTGPSAKSDGDDPGPRVDWIPRTGSPRNATFPNAVTPDAIAVDAARNLWLVGQLYRAVSFGGPTLQPVENGYYLVRLNPDGSHGSSKAITRTGSVWIRRAVADAQGNIYVVGGMYSTGSPLTQSVFVTKFSPEGVEIYNREFPGQDTGAYANDVALASNGELFIIGTYNAPLQIGTTTLTLPATSIDSGFVAALDADTGAPARAMRFGGPDFDVGNSIEVTSTGALRIAGLVSGAATVGGTNVQAAAMGSPFVAELTAAGAASWVRLIEGSGIVFAADTNSADHTFAGGYVEGTIKETFVADAAGGVVTLPLRTTIADDSNGVLFVAADRHGGVWATGDFKGSINFGTGALDAGGASMFANFLVHLEP